MGDLGPPAGPVGKRLDPAQVLGTGDAALKTSAGNERICTPCCSTSTCCDSTLAEVNWESMRMVVAPAALSKIACRPDSSAPQASLFIENSMAALCS